MEKFDKDIYIGLDSKEQNDLGHWIIEWNLQKTRRIDGIKYFELLDPESGRRILVTEELYEEGEKFLYMNLENGLKEGNSAKMLMAIETILEYKKNIPRLKEYLKRLSNIDLANMYAKFYDEIKNADLDIEEFIENEKLYESLSLIYASCVGGEIPEGIEVMGNAIERCKENIESQMQAEGGVETYLEKRKDNKNERKLYSKRKLIKDLSEKEDNKREIELLLELGLDKKDIANLADWGQIVLEDLKKLYETPQLKQRVIEAVGEFNLANVLVIFEVIREPEILGKVKWRLVNSVRIREACNTAAVFSAGTLSKLIVERYKATGNKLNQGEIDSIFKEYEIIEKVRAYFELIKAGLYEEDAILELYEQQVETYNNKVKKAQENGQEEGNEVEYEKQGNNVVVSVSPNVVEQSELLEYFNEDKMISKIKEYNSNIENAEVRFTKRNFIKFYSYILRCQEVGKSEQVDRMRKNIKDKLVEEINNGDIETLKIAIELFEENVLKDLEGVITRENEAMIFDLYLYEEGIADKTMIELYESGVVSEDIINMVYEEELEKESLKEKLENEKMNTSDVVTLFSLGLIDIEELQEVAGNEIDWVEIIKDKKEKGIEININELYSKEIIKYEDIERLKTEGVIGAAQATAILNQIDLEAILQNGLKSEEVDGEETGQTKSKRGPKNKKEQLPIEDREVLLEALGFEATKNKKGDTLVIAKGSFEGYRVYRENEEKYGVLIFEKDGEGSSFIMHKAKAAEFIKKSGDKATLVGRRRDWREESRTSGNVKSRAHSKNWARNIINTIVEVGSTFMFDDEQERAKYVKAENSKLQEEHEDIIDYLITAKEEAKNI